MASQRVPLNSLHTDKFTNYRRGMTDLRPLTDSIRAKGILVPLLVKDRVIEESGKTMTVHDVLDGHRRLEVATKFPDLFKDSGIPIVTFEGTDEEAYFAMFELNDKAKPHTVIETADFLYQMITIRKLKLTDVARGINVSQSWVSRLHDARCKLHRDVLTAVNDDKVPFNVAEEWKDLPEDKDAALKAVKAAKEKGVKLPLDYQLLCLEKYTRIVAKVGKREAKKATTVKPMLTRRAINALFDAVSTLDKKDKFVEGYAAGVGSVLNKVPVPKVIIEAAKAQAEKEVKEAKAAKAAKKRGKKAAKPKSSK